MTTSIKQEKKWTRIVAKAWADEDYKQRLLDNPAEVLRDEGLDVADDITITVVPETEKPTWLALPLQQNEHPDAEEAEERIAAVVW